MVPQFNKELEKLFGKSKNDLIEYKQYLLSQLQIADRTDRHISEYPFEHLSESRQDLFRIKSKSKRKNVRTIYYYRTNETIVLLCAFEEKNSKPDYIKNINIALERIKQIEGEIPL